MPRQERLFPEKQTGPFYFVSGAAQEQGLRSDQQDSFGIGNFGPNGSLYIVADGMGGYSNGKQASDAAVNETIRNFGQNVHRLGKPPIPVSLPEEIVANAILAANSDINNRINAQGGNAGTTIVGAYARPDTTEVLAFNLGDSPMYKVADNEGIKQVSVDHTVGNEKPWDIRNRRDALTRVLGGPNKGPSKIRDIQNKSCMRWVDVPPGTALVLCSDGVSKVVPSFEIEHIVKTAFNPQDAAEMLIERANQLRTKDNTTALVVADGAMPRNTEAATTIHSGKNKLSGMDFRVLASASTQFPRLIDKFSVGYILRFVSQTGKELDQSVLVEKRDKRSQPDKLLGAAKLYPLSQPITGKMGDTLFRVRQNGSQTELTLQQGLRSFTYPDMDSMTIYSWNRQNLASIFPDRSDPRLSSQDNTSLCLFSEGNQTFLLIADLNSANGTIVY